MMMHVDVKSHHGKEIMKVKEDRLSRLPNELIHKILSFISVREAIGLSVLSSRWRSIWTSSPYICFLNVPDFSNFVYDEMSRRINQVHLSSFNLFSWKRLSYSFVNSILDYALSLNVQKLTVTCGLESNAGSPLSLFSSPSLKHLDLLGRHNQSPSYSATPALTTLQFDRITVSHTCIDLFSTCTNLKNLTLERLRMIGRNVFNICHLQLSNLTFEDMCLEGVNVVAPQLKNLTIICCQKKLLMISAPRLTSLVMKGDDPLQISTQVFPSLEKVDLCIFRPHLADAHKIVCLLQQLHSVKLLILNWRLLEVLSSSKGLTLLQPSPFSGLKILKFTPSYPGRVYLEAQAHEKATTSPSTIFTMVSCEDIRVMRNIVSAQELVAESRVLFQHCKALSNTNKADMEQPMESLKIKWHEHSKAQVKRQWAQSPLEMQSHFEMKQEKIEKLVKKLQHVEGLVTELPVSKRDVMQATFSSVCEEAAIVTNNMYEDPI